MLTPLLQRSNDLRALGHKDGTIYPHLNLNHKVEMDMQTGAVEKKAHWNWKEPSLNLKVKPATNQLL